MKGIASFMLIMGLPLVAWGAGDSGARSIQSVHIEGTGFANVASSGTAFANPDGCGASTNVILQASDSQYNQNLATILTAAATGKQVEFWLVGCTNTPWGATMPVIYSVTLVNQ